MIQRNFPCRTIFSFDLVTNQIVGNSEEIQLDQLDTSERSLESRTITGYYPKSLVPNFEKIVGKYFHPIFGEINVTFKKRISCGLQDERLYTR